MNNEIVFLNKRRFWEVDPRIKCIVAFVGSMILTVISKEITLLWLFTLALGWCIYCGKWKNAVVLGVLYGLLQYWAYTMLTAQETSGLIIAATILRRFLMLGAFVVPLVSVKIGALISAMHKLKIPRFMIISMAIIFRFLPTLREEYRAVRASQKNRGIGRSIINVVLHPIVFYETLLIPLTIRIMKISDELSASAILRGADRKGNGTCFRDVKIIPTDLIVLLLILAGVVFALGLDYEWIVLGGL